MKRKIFVSYKYGDTNILKISNDYIHCDTVRNYVDVLEKKICDNDIYKGEEDDNDLSIFTDDTIWTKLKQKIFDSSITIVLISPGMKENYKPEKEQWIPQEISYSLRTIIHNYKKKSLPNGLIYCVLPDKNGSYSYYINYDLFGNVYSYNKCVTFDIMNKNMNNWKYNCNISYPIIVQWDKFMSNYNKYIEDAIRHSENVENYNLKIAV